jgi:hypothetical protein
VRCSGGAVSAAAIALLRRQGRARGAAALSEVPHQSASRQRGGRRSASSSTRPAVSTCDGGIRRAPARRRRLVRRGGQRLLQRGAFAGRRVGVWWLLLGRGRRWAVVCLNVVGATERSGLSAGRGARSAHCLAHCLAYTASCTLPRVYCTASRTASPRRRLVSSRWGGASRSWLYLGGGRGELGLLPAPVDDAGRARHRQQARRAEGLAAAEGAKHGRG